MIPLTELPWPPQGRRKPHPVVVLRAGAWRGAYRLFPTDLHIPPVPRRIYLLTTSTSTKGAAAQEERLERWPGHFSSEWKTSQGNPPEAWIPPSTGKLFHAASCATPLGASAKTQQAELCKHDAVKSSLEANLPSIWSHCDPHGQQGLPTVHTPGDFRIVSPSQPPNSQC